MVTMGSRLQSPAQPERVIIVSWSWCSSICRKTRASSFLAPAAMPQVPMWKLILTRGGPFSRERWRDVLSLIASRSIRLDTCIDHGQVGWMPAFRVLTEGGEGGNGLQTWSQSRPCNNIFLTRKPRPCACLPQAGPASFTHRTGRFGRRPRARPGHGCCHLSPWPVRDCSIQDTEPPRERTSGL